MKFVAILFVSVMLTLLTIMVVNAIRFDLKVDQCVVQHAKEVHEVNRYCTALVRKGHYDDI